MPKPESVGGVITSYPFFFEREREREPLELSFCNGRVQPVLLSILVFCCPLVFVLVVYAGGVISVKLCNTISDPVSFWDEVGRGPSFKKKWRM
jgi:hypothetical protein